MLGTEVAQKGGGGGFGSLFIYCLYLYLSIWSNSGVCSGRLKKGVLCADTVLGAGPAQKKGGLMCGSGQKGGGGVLTAAHTNNEHICECPPGCKLSQLARYVSYSTRLMSRHIILSHVITIIIDIIHVLL